MPSQITLQRRTTLVVVSEETETRLEGKVFRRQPKIRYANNFSHWRSLRDLFRDPIILDHLFTDIEEALQMGTLNVGLEIDYEKMVGWAGTDLRGKYPQHVLNSFRPTKKSSGLRVDIRRTDIPAPTTNLLTIAYRLHQWNRNRTTATIQDVYPGPDLGEYWGDMTKREKRIFFHDMHPGIPTHLKPLKKIV